MKLTDFADRTLEDFARVVSVLPTRMGRMADAASPIRAATYDGNGGHSSTVSDPTGSPPHGTLDAIADRRDTEKDLKALAVIVDRLMWRMERYPDPVPQSPSDRLGIGYCEDCGRECDGRDDRLRLSANGLHRFCDACRKRESRFKPTEAAS